MTLKGITRKISELYFSSSFGICISILPGQAVIAVAGKYM
jgi:hypothetical protein